MTTTYARLDTWELLKAHVLEHAPGMALRLTERQAEPWRALRPIEAQVCAVMVALDLDRENAAERRRARRLVQDLLAPAAGESSNVVRETPPTDLATRLTPRARQRLVTSLQWLATESPAGWLRAATGPVAAAATLRRKAPALDGIRAWEWLAAVGYPAIVPDGARQRLLARLGWMDERPRTRAGIDDAQRRMEELARTLGVSPAEFDEIAGTFAGVGPASAREAAVCTLTPRCTACPLTAQCPFFRTNRRALQARSRNLQATMRLEQRPRERLQANGPGALSDEELLAILLRTGGGGRNALDVAHEILHAAGSIDRLAALSVAELARFPGMGVVKATTVKAALELARRIGEAPAPGQRVRLNSGRRVFDYMRPLFVGMQTEQFHALHLNTKMDLIRRVLVTSGTLNQSLVHPRESFAEAIRDAAYAIVFVHNHPTGDPAPSREDRVVTGKLVQAGEIVGIPVVDHVIVAGDRFYSFADEGELKK
ncbi:MAG: DNA repair protein RadC [Candidatus Sumerlaeia bacterium]|nr:DNA repair protein RadC [Candidatus Sumerlaeia bacterium]